MKCEPTWSCFFARLKRHKAERALAGGAFCCVCRLVVAARFFLARLLLLLLALFLRRRRVVQVGLLVDGDVVEVRRSLDAAEQLVEEATVGRLVQVEQAADELSKLGLALDLQYIPVLHSFMFDI